MTRDEMTYKLLIVEDNQDAADVVAFAVRMNWPNCNVTRANDGKEALRLFEKEQPDMVVLDINIPPPDGFQVCHYIRESSQVPVLMLTGRHAMLDKIRALDLGADDYLTKPFDLLELLARLRAIARRSNKWNGKEVSTAQVLHEGTSTTTGHMEPESDSANAPQSSQELSIGDITVNLARRELYVGGQLLPLTSTEYRLLEELIRHAGSVLPHSYLLE